jgi:hypothetical protein
MIHHIELFLEGQKLCYCQPTLSYIIGEGIGPHRAMVQKAKEANTGLSCSHSTKELAEAFAKVLNEINPALKAEAVEGPCPAYEAEEDDCDDDDL